MPSRWQKPIAFPDSSHHLPSLAQRAWASNPRLADSAQLDRQARHGYAKGVSKNVPLDTVFAALADPTRREILSMLLEDDMAVTDVAEPFDMSLAAISKHLNVLTNAGLISQEKFGRVKWCKLEPDALRDASIWMQSFGQFEAVNLDAFERFLAREIPGTDEG